MESATQEIRVPWDRLRAWIDSQEALEKAHNRPAPLSRAELEALSLFVSFDNSEKPDVGDRDYVSALNLMTQARHMSPPVFVDEVPVSVPVGGHSQSKWRCVCSIAGYGSFPRQDYGIEAGQGPPAFLSKKNAKRYAAKHALQYMQDSLSSATSHAPKRTAAALTPSPTAQSPAPKIVKKTSPQHQPQAPEDSRPSNQDSDEASVFKQVSTLAQQLGFDSPAYRVEPDDERPSFFRGRPVFAHGSLVPLDVGVVHGVLGKRQAKIQAAEKLLKWLEEARKRRSAVFESMFSKPQQTS